jgi:hypothetical protein
MMEGWAKKRTEGAIRCSWRRPLRQSDLGGGQGGRSDVGDGQEGAVGCLRLPEGDDQMLRGDSSEVGGICCRRRPDGAIT